MTGISPTGNKKPVTVAGFSLVELLITLLITSILATSLSLFVFKREPSLQDLARQIAHQLRLAQQHALVSREAYQVRFDLERNRVDLVDSSVEIPPEVTLTIRTAENNIIDRASVGMTFYPDASASGGSIELARDQEVFVVEVMWVTGKVRVRSPDSLEQAA